MRALSIAVFLLCLSCGDAVRKKRQQQKGEDPDPEVAKAREAYKRMKAKMENVQRGDQKLIPALVPGPGQIFEVANRERLDLIESNEYRWKLVSVTDAVTGAKQVFDEWFATIDGSYLSNSYGWKSTVVSNNEGQALFKIHMTKHIWNVFRWTWSFRISDPETDEVLYTINKDWFGTGVFWARDEWRVYRGKKRDGEQVYHCVGSYGGYGFKCYHNKQAYKNWEDPVAESSQSMLRDFVGAPDVFTMKVKENEDTALLMSVSVVMDMVHEQTEKDDQAKEEEERQKEEEERRRQEEESQQGSFVESDDTVEAERPRRGGSGRR